MKSFPIMAFVVLTGGASAQGLLGILPTIQEMETKPLVLGVGVNAGYDTNVNTDPTDEVDSFYTGGQLNLDYRYATERTIFSIGASGGATYFFDQAQDADNLLYSAKVGGALTHAITDRLSIDDKFYIGYDFDPNFITGASTNRRNDEYIFGFNSLAVNYLWTDRLSTSTGFSIGTTLYDEDTISNTEDRVEYGANQLVRYALSEQAGLRAEYRFNYTDYDSGISSTSNIVTGGVDYQFDENTMLVAMAGIEMYDNDLRGEETRPYGELGLSRVLTDELTIRWANRVGFERTGVGVYQSNYTYRTNLDMTYQLTEKLSGFVGGLYLYTDYSGDPGNKENLIEGRVGLNYALTPAIGLGLSYSYTNLDSDVEMDGYERQRINLGLNATF
ncbi:MAG: outer membrane beta-barrel protein [Verrucomicrobiales bacterium]